MLCCRTKRKRCTPMEIEESALATSGKKSKPRKIYLYVNVDSKKKSILKLEQRSNGDVLIMPAKPVNTNEFPRDASGFGVHDFSTSRSVKNLHLTLHRSTESEESINAFNFTVEHEEGENIRNSQYTKTLKVHGRYCFVIHRLVSDLRNERYDLGKRKISDELVSLGRNRPVIETFEFCIFVCAPSNNLSINIQPPFDYIGKAEVTLDYFKIVVLYSTIKMPSLPYSSYLTAITAPEERRADLMNNPSVFSMGGDILGADISGETNAYDGTGCIYAFLHFSQRNFLNQVWSTASSIGRQDVLEFIDQFERFKIFGPPRKKDYKIPLFPKSK